MNFSNQLLTHRVSLALPYTPYPIPDCHNVLKFLALALSHSLAAYAFNSVPVSPATAPQRRPNPSPPKIPQNVIEILSDDEEIPKERTINLPKGVDKGNKRNNPLPNTISAHHKAVELSPTSQEVPLESAQTHSKTKPIKKGKSERRQAEFKVEIPKVDLIDTVDAPYCKMFRVERGRLRESLMRRRVSEWVSVGKKQKKEVRLLKQ